MNCRTTHHTLSGSESEYRLQGSYAHFKFITIFTIPPSWIHSVHLYRQECHKSKFGIFFSYWYRKKRLQMHF